MQPFQSGVTARVGIALLTVILILILVGGVLLARRNVRLGRGDRRGAFRLAVYLFSLNLVFFILRLHHVPEFSEVALLLVAVQNCLLIAAVVWLVYIALEPYVRRLWPDVLISWSRLLTGRFRDPLFGRDILVGALAGVFLPLLASFWRLAGAAWLGFPAPRPFTPPAEILDGVREAAAFCFASLVNSLFLPIAILFIILLLRVILRRQWAAVGAGVLVLAAAEVLLTLGPVLGWAGPKWLLITVYALASASGWALYLFVLIRFGLLASIVMQLFESLFYIFPLSFDLSAWYAGRVLVVYLLALALVIYGFSISRAGRSLLADEFLPA